MILAAGRGERMRPLTDSLPKPLLEVGGKPLIVWHIERLAAVGITDIVINHAWLGHKFPEILGDGSQFGVDIQYSAEETGLETAGGIANALTLLGDAPFLVMNGDIWCDWNPMQVMAQLSPIEQGQSQAWLLMVDNPAHNPNGDFHLDTKGFLQNDGTPKLTFAGIGLYDPSLFRDITPGSVAKLAPILRHAMQQQQVLGAHYTGQWTDVGTPERLQEIDRMLSRT